MKKAAAVLALAAGVAVLVWLYRASVNKDDPARGIRRHVVRRGDTLDDIAQAWGTDYRTLALENGIDDPDRIEVGQVITHTVVDG